MTTSFQQQKGRRNRSDAIRQTRQRINLRKKYEEKLGKGNRFCPKKEYIKKRKSYGLGEEKTSKHCHCQHPCFQQNS